MAMQPVGAGCRTAARRVQKMVSSQSGTDFKACFHTQLADGLRWTLNHCCIDNGLRRLLIRRWVGARGAPCRPPKHCGACFPHLAFFRFAAGKTVGPVAYDEKPSQ
jgi:hypothetical protein